jgi:hypothetical protein
VILHITWDDGSWCDVTVSDLVHAQAFIDGFGYFDGEWTVFDDPEYGGKPIASSVLEC